MVDGGECGVSGDGESWPSFKITYTTPKKRETTKSTTTTVIIIITQKKKDKTRHICRLLPHVFLFTLAFLECDHHENVECM